MVHQYTYGYQVPFFCVCLERRFHTLSRGALKTQLWYLPLCARNKSIQRCTTWRNKYPIENGTLLDGNPWRPNPELHGHRADTPTHTSQWPCNGETWGSNKESAERLQWSVQRSWCSYDSQVHGSVADRKKCSSSPLLKHSRQVSSQGVCLLAWSNGMIWDLLLPLLPQPRDRNGHALPSSTASSVRSVHNVHVTPGSPMRSQCREWAVLLPHISCLGRSGSCPNTQVPRQRHTMREMQFAPRLVGKMNNRRKRKVKESSSNQALLNMSKINMPSHCTWLVSSDHDSKKQQKALKQ